MNTELIKNIRKILSEKSLDCIVFYTTSTDTKSAIALLGKPVMSASYILITTDQLLLSVVRYLDSDDYFSECDKIPVFEENVLAKTIQDYIASKRFSSIGYYADVPFSGIFSRQREFTDCTDSVDALFCIKSENDITAIRESASITMQCLNSIEHKNYLNKTDTELSHYISLYAVNNYCQLSFPTSVVVDQALRETTVALPSNKNISDTSAFAIDMGFIHNGFYSDCTRMYFADNDTKKKVYDRLVDIHRKIITEITVGYTLGQVSELYKKSFDLVFDHYDFLIEDLGHSIGYELHEPPIFIQNNADFILKKNMIITLEPEIVVDGFHYRIEDMILVTDIGCEILTQ
jgi:Xaa-Pro aminopeptidase